MTFVVTDQAALADILTAAKAENWQLAYHCATCRNCPGKFWCRKRTFMRLVRKNLPCRKTYLNLTRSFVLGDNQACPQCSESSGPISE
jgi:hypothetical protein